jgi:hypothetical protein
LEDLKKQERIALIWINQQPNLDYKTLWLFNNFKKKKK